MYIYTYIYIYIYICIYIYLNCLLIDKYLKSSAILTKVSHERVHMEYEYTSKHLKTKLYKRYRILEIIKLLF